MVVAVPVLVVPVGPSRASAADDRIAAVTSGFRMVGKTTYTLDPAAGVVHVVFDATVTNQTPDRVTSTGRFQSYLSSITVPVLTEAVALHAAKSDGSALTVTTKASGSPRFQVAVVDLRPNVFYPSSQTLRFTYDLPRVAARSDGFTRINDAFATFPMLAVGDPGMAEVEVVIPDTFKVEIVGSDMRITTRDGQHVYTASGIADPEQWFAQVSARNDAKLNARAIDLTDGKVKVLGWPDDSAWVDFAATQVKQGVPAIEKILGLAWPSKSTLEVVETTSPYLYGYAGWYRRNDSLIEVGDDLDQQVILHELSHLWFNDTLFRDRWVNEGFANEMASLAMGRLGVTAPKPRAIDAADPGRLQLNDWSQPDLQQGGSDDQERFGYNTAWAVLSAIVDEVGQARLAAVVQQADSGRDAYQGPKEKVFDSTVFDWKGLLDLFDEVGGSHKAADLFERYVVSADDRALFAARTTARQHYAALVAAGKGWAAPKAVRLAMSGWDFTTAERGIHDASSVLATRNQVMQVARDLDVSSHLALQATYEDSTLIPELKAAADRALATARAVQSAEHARHEGAGPLGAIGLLFSPVDQHLRRADRAFDRGSYDDARAEAAKVESTMNDAPLTGVVRLLGLLLLVGVVALLRRVVRARRARRTAAGPASLEAALQADGAESVGSSSDGGGEAGV